MDRGICITRGLKASHTRYDVVPPDRIDAVLGKHHDCYEITLPITKGEVMLVEGTNRPYIDLDGEAPAEWDEETFDAFHEELCETIEFVMRTQLKLPYSLVSASQHASIKGNKLSFHLVILNKHGSRDAVKSFVLSLYETLRDGLTQCSLLLTGDPKPETDKPILVLDTGIYNANRKIRCWGSSKDDENRPFRSVSDGTTLDTLITYIPDGCEPLAEPLPPPPPPSASDTSESSDPKDIDEAMPDKVALLRDVLAALNPKRVVMRDYWLRMGFALHNEGVPVSVWEDITVRHYPRYKNGSQRDCVKKWNEMVPRNLTQSILWLWLREDNPIKYAELSARRMDFWGLLRDPVAFPCAQFFANTRPDQYLYHADLGWFQRRSSGAWQLFKKGEIPDGLTRDIWATFGRIAKEHLARLDPNDETNKGKVKACLEIQSSAGERKFVSDVIWALPSFYNDEDLVKKMDESRHLFAFSDKVVDLNTMEVRPIAPMDFVCITTGYAYPKKSNPEVRREIRRVLRGLWDNDEMCDFVLLVLSMSLYGKNLAELFFLWKGKGGNGKGLLAELVKKAFGNYFHGVPIATFTYADNRKDATNDNIVNSKGKRFVLTMEPEADVKLQGGFLKELSGGDEITARGLYARPITFTPQFGIHIQVNIPPPMSKMDNGVRRRLVVLPFPFQFKSKEDYTGGADERVADGELKDKMSKTAEWRDEFILMLFEAYAKLPKNRCDLVRPQMVRDATNDYLNEQNPLKAWLDAEFEKLDTEDKRYWWSASDLRDMFLNYTRMDPSAMSAVKFAEALTVLNGVTKKTQSNNFMGPVWTGDGFETQLRKAGSYYIGLRKKTEVAE